jgi:hypothetical protein
LIFSGLDQIYAGTSADQFNFTEAGTIAALINAGSGVDEINYSAYNSSATVNLTTGSATGVHLGALSSISGFENITGSEFADTLTGDTQNNTITVWPGMML